VVRLRATTIGVGAAALFCAGALSCGRLKEASRDASPGTAGAPGEAGFEAAADADGPDGEAGDGGTLAPATLEIEGSPFFDFGVTVLGATRTHTFIVTNAGDVAATAISAGELAAGPIGPEGGSWPGRGGTCGGTLAAGASCLVVIAFLPVAAGAAGATFTLTYDDGEQPRTVVLAIQGAGTPPALLVVSDAATYDFGGVPVGSTVEHTFTITNTGGVDATMLALAELAAPLSFKGGPAPGVGGTCAATLGSGASCAVVVTFAPSGPGLVGALLVIGYRDGLAARVVTGALEGQGVPL
jgi:hypothetical protein